MKQVNRQAVAATQATTTMMMMMMSSRVAAQSQQLKVCYLVACFSLEFELRARSRRGHEVKVETTQNASQEQNIWQDRQASKEGPRRYQ